MSSFARHGVACVGEVEDGESVQEKIAVINGSVAADVNHNLVGLEFPFGLWKFAGSDAAVIDHVVIGAGFLHELAAERKRSRGHQDDPSSA